MEYPLAMVSKVARVREMLTTRFQYNTTRTCIPIRSERETTVEVDKLQRTTDETPNMGYVTGLASSNGEQR